MSLTNFNLYIFWGHRGEFCDLVTSLSTKVEPLPYSELRIDLSIHEFLHRSSLQSISTVAPLLPTPTQLPSVFATQRGFSGFNGSDSSPHQGRGRHGGWRNPRSNFNEFSGQTFHGNSGGSSRKQNRGYGGNWQQHRSAATNQWPRQIRWQLCNKVGHSAQQCSHLVHHGNQSSATFSFSDTSAGNSVTWFPDTGVNQHVTPDITGMTYAEPYLDNDQLHVGDGKGLVISNTTYNILHTPKRAFTLSNIIHVPQIKKQLISFQQFYRENCLFLISLLYTHIFSTILS
jgi:hypothetical protein